MSAHGWEGFADYCKALAAEQGTGRKSLRRDWTNLRAVAARVIESIPDEVVMSLLGKAKTALNPEENDLKALVGYAVGQGLLGSEELREALDADDRASPLYWLAGLSGKSFGEKLWRARLSNMSCRLLMIGEHFLDDASGPCCFNRVGVDVFGECDQTFP